MGYSTREKKPVSYTYEYNVSDDDDVYEYKVNPSKEKKKKKKDYTINESNDSDFNSSNSDSQYWKKSKNLQEKKEDAQLRQVLKLSMLEHENYQNDNVEIIVNEKSYEFDTNNSKNEEENVLTDELVNDDLVNELSKTDVSDISSLTLESDISSHSNKEKEIYQLDDNSSDFDDFKPSKKSKNKREENVTNESKSIKRKRKDIEEEENIIISEDENNYDNETETRVREHTPVLSKSSDNDNYDGDDDNDDDDVYKEEDENYISDRNDDTEDEYDDYSDSRKKKSKKKKTTTKIIPKSSSKSNSKIKSSTKKDSKSKTSKIETLKTKEIVSKKAVTKKSINSPIIIKSPKQKIGISRSSIKLPNSSTSKNPDFNEISLLSWGSGQTKDDISHNHIADTNLNFDDGNLLSETIQEFDEAMGNTKTESLIEDEFDGDMKEIINVDNEINYNIEIIDINNNKKGNTNHYIAFEKDIENHELYPSQVIPEKDIRTINVSLNNKATSDSSDSLEKNGYILKSEKDSRINNLNIDNVTISTINNSKNKSSSNKKNNINNYKDNDVNDESKIKYLYDNNNNKNLIYNDESENNVLLNSDANDNSEYIDELELKNMDIINENKTTFKDNLNSNNKEENINSFIFHKKDDEFESSVYKKDNNDVTEVSEKNIENNEKINSFEDNIFKSNKSEINYDKNDMKKYDIIKNHNFKDTKINSIDNIEKKDQVYSCCILRKIDPKTDDFKNDFEIFLKKIERNIKAENIEISTINDELKINMEYENNRKYILHSTMDNDYDFNYEYKKSNFDNKDNILHKNLSLEEYTSIFKDFERNMEIFSKMFNQEKLEKISDIINSGIKLINTMCKTSKCKNKNKSIAKNKKNRIILNNIINIINSLISNEKNKSRNEPSKAKHIKEQKMNEKQFKICNSNKLIESKIICRKDYIHTFDDQEIFNDLRPPHYNDTEDEIFFVPSKTLLIEWNDYVNQLRILSKTIAKKKYISLIMEICYAQYNCCILAKIIYNYMSFPSAYHLSLLSMDYMKAGLHEQSYEYILKAEKLMKYLNTKRKLYSKIYYNKEETDEEYKLRVKETEWIIYNVLAFFDINNNDYEHANCLLKKSFLRSKVFKNKDSKYISLISETYKIAIILSAKNKNYDQSTKYIYEWLYLINNEMDKANISFEYTKLLLKHKQLSEETLNFAINSYNIYSKENMDFQKGLSAGLIGKIYYKMNNFYNTQDYMMTAVSVMTSTLLEDPIFYKEYFPILYEYEYILMNSYFEVRNYKEAQECLDKIISNYDFNSSHIYDLEIYQAIIYANSGYIVKVFKTLNMILDNVKPNSEQIAKCTKCFDLLFDHHRNQIINYLQSPSRTIKNIIFKITKTNNIMNWINSQVLSSDNRKFKSKKEKHNNKI
ncbi:hypothetical protein BCR36DRAFT_398347 [Piromyces finnis]|uniref:TPR-like protein n=1 Tax=Piromyces finnis TaxID=1754191 RepID=A0A1Y1V5R2_9FUNG|nr:hypothetical protein BCR36DRAFT_398347 [Piromyces finnis]|eukprot:ORX47891.1 hypothetical protein BCR36DRAFT_398347 [Piromyces finnis]